MTVLWIRAIAVAVCMSMVPLTAAHAVRWFQIGPPNIDEAANGAVDKLSSGMSTTILALNGGRQQKAPVDKDLADRAIVDLQSAQKQFEVIATKIPLRKINQDTIRGAGVEKQFEELRASLKQLGGYKELVDGPSFMAILTTTIGSMVEDLRTLTDKKASPGDVQKAFLDLIARKVLLEQIGSLSGDITKAMQ